ncbi:hypothetical protein [Kineococcus sp. SYSU DK018]|uniref:hypothetical protein n=1 Tax=Kineococcus sp. SYSU DK018 TaxID=3383139 RepID=UPI003D7EF272
MRLYATDDVMAEHARRCPQRQCPHLHAFGAMGMDERWLLATPGFRRAALESRGGSWQTAGRTSDPQRALSNLLERDRLFTDELRERVRRERLRAVEVGTSWTQEQLLCEVAVRLGLERGLPPSVQAPDGAP